MNNEYDPNTFRTNYEILVHFNHETKETTLEIGKLVNGEIKYFHKINGHEARRLYEESRHWAPDGYAIEIDKLAKKYDPEVQDGET